MSVNSLSSDFLIEWIHRIYNDQKKAKRLDGFVTEIFFEKKLARATLDLANPAFGWGTCELAESKHNRYWFKVESNFKPNETERLLFNKFSSSRRDFFFVLSPRASISSQPDKALQIEFDICQWDFSKSKGKEYPRKGGFANTEARKVFEKTLSSANINNTLSDLAKKSLAEQKIKPWLSANMSPDDLICLLGTRCILDFVLKSAVDRDAIDSHNGKLRYIEFKRKYPTPSGWWQKAENPSFATHLQEATRLDHMYSNAYWNAEDDNEKIEISKKWEHEIRNELKDSTRWSSTLGSCFGLDLSHIKVIQDAEQAGISYHHVIWNEHETELSKLLNTDLTPKKACHPLRLDLTTSSFKGLTMTPGIKSSFLHQRPRMQLIFPSPA